MSTVTYIWEGNVQRKKVGEHRERTVYTNKHFKKLGTASNKHSGLVMEGIISDVKDYSGLVIPRDKRKIAYSLIIGSIFYIILGAFLLLASVVAGIIFIVLGLLTFWAGCFMICACYEPVGKKSSIERVGKYLNKKRISWDEKLEPFGYKMSWVLDEKSTSYVREEKGDKKIVEKKCPAVTITFSHVGLGTGGTRIQAPLVVPVANNPIQAVPKSQFEKRMVTYQGRGSTMTNSS